MQTTRKTPEQIAEMHGIDLGHELTSGFAQNLIRRKSKQLVRKSCFRVMDVEDIEQELRLNLMQSMRKFDPNVSHWNAFVTTVVERHVATMIQAAKRQRRKDEESVGSLSATVLHEDGEETTLAQMIRNDERLGALGCAALSPEDHFALREDMEKVVATLPDDLQDLVERLKTDTITQIARDLQIPRTTLYRKVDELRKAFEVVVPNDF